MDNNAKLKLIINYLDKSSEIDLDNNESFEQAKTNIAKELTIPDKDKDNIFVKFFDIKYEKLSSQENFQLKLDLFNYENSKEMVELQNEIEFLSKELESINKQYEESIKQIQDNFKSFKENIIKQNNENYNLVKDEINEVISNNKRENENKDNNLYVDKNKEKDILGLISQIQKEIKEIKEYQNNNHINDELEKYINKVIEENKEYEENKIEDIDNIYDEKLKYFKKMYKTINLGFTDEKIINTLKNKNGDFFDTMSDLIILSYENLEKPENN